MRSRRPLLVRHRLVTRGVSLFVCILCVWAVLLYRFDSVTVTTLVHSRAQRIVPPVLPMLAEEPMVHRAKRDTNSSALEASLVVYSHVDPGWLRTVQGYWEAGHGDAQVGVHKIISDAVRVLSTAPTGAGRKYTWGETLYLERWWKEANATERELLHQLVSSGRFAFAGGGWVSPDEATTHATDIIDAYALGHEWLWSMLGVPPPYAGWQIDTFGHSSSHAEIAWAVGARAMFFSRIDTEDRCHRVAAKQLEFLWDTVPGSARGSDLWCYAFFNGVYDIPPALSELQSKPPTETVAAEAWWTERLKGVMQYIVDVSAVQRGSGPIMISISRDFGWKDIDQLYANLDELIRRANAGGQVELSYATPAEHAMARATEDVPWPVQQGDLFPYSDCKGCYWSGYFSTRPSTKRLVREASGLLAISRQLELLSRGILSGKEPSPAIHELARAVALMQHHDAITGTDMAHVNEDYRRIVTSAMNAARAIMTTAFNTLVHDNTDVPGFSMCEAANETMCGSSVTLSDKLAPFTVVAYSALPRKRDAFIEVPLGLSAASRSWTAVSLSSGKRLPVQVLHLRNDTRALQDYLLSVHAHEAALKADAVAVFHSHIPGMGFETWSLEPDSTLTTTLTACEAFPANCSDDGQKVLVTNGLIELTFDRSLGGLSFVEVVGGAKLNVSVSLRRYIHQRDTGVLPWYLRPSGHYSFHPAGESQQLTSPGEAADLHVTSGPLLTEVTHRFCAFGSLTFRLLRGAKTVDVEWTVGPLPSAQDIILLFETSMETKGVFWTDSNGRPYVKRERGTRSTFVPATLQPPHANPIARDYYPTTVGAYIEDSATHEQLSVLTDRAQGCASVEDGSLEFMLHREAEAGDELGNPETLHERLGGQPIIVRGKSVLAVTRISDGPRTRREVAAFVYHAPLIAFAPAAPNSVKQSTASLLARDLAPQVDVLKFGAGNIRNSVDLRVAHMFDDGECDTLSKPVQIDLTSFGGLKAADVVETMVTGVPANAVSQLYRPPLRGERIFAGPKLFNYLNFSEPGTEQPWQSALAQKKPEERAALTKRNGGLRGRERLTLQPLGLRNIRFTTLR
jgi:Glycosyl hydrolases family 38 N-terminal domain/Glycosyl hydrolases family 38 C-terminal domain/Alpha mannosidase middle domain